MGPAPALSLVIPAFDEEPRLEETLRRLTAWSESPPRGPVELILVDDGSRDETLARLRDYARTRPAGSVQVLANPHRGKAYAVRSGIRAARGGLILFSDADLATPLEEAAGLLAAVARGADVAIGSREAPGARREGEPLYRHALGRGFNRLVQALLLPGIRDTQCGFKLFRREVAMAVFARLRRHGPDAPPVRGPLVTAFDVEVLFVARRLGYRVAEVPVRWVYGEGSKVRPLADTARMGGDVLAVAWGALRGRYE